jgi:hypothetical protein
LNQTKEKSHRVVDGFRGEIEVALMQANFSSACAENRKCAERYRKNQAYRESDPST